MSGIPIRVFGGVKPQVDAHILPPQLAQSAQNCRIKSGTLSPWRAKLAINTPTKAGTKLSIYRLTNASVDYWLSWTTDVDVVKSQLANDAFGRYYYTGDGEPRTMTAALVAAAGAPYPNTGSFFTLGLPIPTTPTVGIAGGASATTRTTAYYYTGVTAWGEESQPSLPVTATGKIDAVWTVAMPTVAQPGGGTYQLATKNLYRTVFASDGTSTILLVASGLALATASYADSALDSTLTGGTVLPSVGWLPPPTTLSGLCSLPNGSLAGFSGNTLYISVPYQPHAWPLANQYSVDFQIVGIKANGSTIAVCTTANPYTFTGINSSAMTPNKSKVIEPCLSKRSMVDVGWGVLYSSPNGLANALDDGTSGEQLATDGSILPKDWKDSYFPSTMLGAVYQEMYHGFFTTGGIVWGRESPTDGFRQSNDLPTAVWLDPLTGLFYIVVGGTIYQWDADTNNQATLSWKSKIFVENKPLNYGAAQIDADFPSLGVTTGAAAQLVIDTAYNVAFLATSGMIGTGGPLGATMLGQITLGGDLLHGNGGIVNTRFINLYVYAYGVLKYTKSVTSRAPLKLPSGFKSANWEIMIASNVDVYSVRLAENTKALERL